jgi:Holliday junction DNA helicase RuvA
VIASLRGRVSATRAGAIVLDVGGVGYLVAATASAVRRAGDAGGGEITIHTHLHVREDTLQLYGFASTAERSLFELLLGVSGVGPKAALAIVSGFAPDQIRRAVATGDHALFTSIPGIGRRTAERVVVDLKDKVGAVEIAVASADGDGGGGGDHAAARDALVGLGMTVAEAEAALREVDDDAPIEERVRRALAGSLTGAA